MTPTPNRGGAPLGNTNRKLPYPIERVTFIVRQDQLEWLNKQEESRSETVRQAIDLLMNIKGDISHT